MFKKRNNAILVSAVIVYMALQLCGAAKADPQRLLNFQGRLVDTNGVPIADGLQNITFQICTDSACTAVVWTEAHTGGSAVQVTDGLFSVILGGITSLNTVDFNSANYYIQTQIGATVYAPTQQITGAMVAYNVPDSVITSAKVLNDTLVNADINSAAAIVDTKLATISTAGKVNESALTGTNWTDLTDSGLTTLHQHAAATLTGVYHVGPTTQDIDTTLNSSFWLNKTGASGNLIDAEVNAVNKFVVAYDGTIDTASVDSTSVVDNSLAAADIGDGLGLTEIDETVFQQRVSGTCTNNTSAIYSIAQGGTVSCTTKVSSAGIADDLVCTDCISNTEITDVYVYNTSDTMSGSLGIGTSLTVGTTLGVTGASTLTGGAVVDTYAVGYGGWNIALQFPNASHAALYYPQGGLLFGLHSNGNFYWANTVGAYYAMTLTNTGNLSTYGTITGTRLISTVAIGTAPMTVTSTTKVTNLNADLLDDYDWTNVPNATDIWVNEGGDTMIGNLVMSAADVDFSEDLGDKVLLYGAAAAAGSYVNGIESSTYYWRTGQNYRWYGSAVQDGGVSEDMELDTAGNALYMNSKETIAYGDSWLRLNGAGGYGSGIYTPGLLRADGGFQVDGSYVIDAAGQYFYNVAGGVVNKWGGVNASGWGVDATNSGDWDVLVYENDVYLQYSNASGHTNIGGDILDYNDATVNIGENLYVNGDISAASYTTLDARYLNASGGDTGSGGTYNFTNAADGANVANFTGGADNTAYEWVGFYSGASRLGIFLWDGAWNECLANEFCITGDAGPLSLDSNGTIYMRDPVDHENNGIVDINWAASDDGSGSGLDADLLDGADSTAYKCEVLAFTVGTTTNCTAGKAVVSAMDTSYRMQNPGNFTGAPTNGRMICCPTNAW